MDAITHTTITTLDRLLEVTIDGIAGYRRASETIGDPELSQTLAGAAREREEIANAIAGVLTTLGQRPPHHGTLKGAMHRGWLNALSVTHAEKAILNECLRGERSTLDEFSEALAKELLPNARECVQTQVGRVVTSLERLETAVHGPALVRRPSMPPASVGAVAGAVTGAIAGGIAGPAGSIAGGVLGAIAGGAAAKTMDEVTTAADAKDRELDRQIGVTEGSVGLGAVKPRPPASPARSSK